MRLLKLCTSRESPFVFISFGDKSPQTALGKDVAICFIWLGVMTLGFVFSFLGTSLSDPIECRERLRIYDFVFHGSHYYIPLPRFVVVQFSLANTENINEQLNKKMEELYKITLSHTATDNKQLVHVKGEDQTLRTHRNWKIKKSLIRMFLNLALLFAVGIGVYVHHVRAPARPIAQS